MAATFAWGRTASVLMSSRPQEPRPITATFSFGPGSLASSSAACAAGANNSTPPNMVIKVVTELLFRKSRRLNPGKSFSFMLILDGGLRFRIAFLQPERPLDPAQNMFLVGFAHLFGILAFKTLRRIWVPDILAMAE